MVHSHCNRPRVPSRRVPRGAHGSCGSAMSPPRGPPWRRRRELQRTALSVAGALLRSQVTGCSQLLARGHSFSRALLENSSLSLLIMRPLCPCPPWASASCHTSPPRPKCHGARPLSHLSLSAGSLPENVPRLPLPHRPVTVTLGVQVQRAPSHAPSESLCPPRTPHCLSAAPRSPVPDTGPLVLSQAAGPSPVPETHHLRHLSYLCAICHHEVKFLTGS